METPLAVIVNVASIAGLCYFTSCLKQENFKLREIKNAKVYSPARLLAQLAQSEFLNNLKKSADNPNEYLLKAFIEGYTECDHPIQSIIDEKSKLVHSLYFRDKMYSNDSITKAKAISLPNTRKAEVRAPLSFHLRDPSKDTKCLIHRNLNVDAHSALEKIAETREYKTLNLVEKILVYLGLLLELIGIITRTAVIFRGVKIGTIENEFGILLGDALTAYGEVIYNAKEKSLRIDAPQYILQDKLNIIKKIKSNIYGIQGKMALLLIPFLITSVYLTRKGLAYYKMLRRRRMEQRLDKLWKTKSVKMKDDYKCIVCFDRPRNVIPKPCLHFSLCSICYNQLEKKSCPVCKKMIMDIIEVYIT